MKDMSDAHLVAVDLETSGVNPFLHDVLSIAFVPFNDDLPSHVAFVRPQEIRWNEYARANFSKYATEWDDRAVSPSEACDGIEAYLAETFGGKPVTPVGHNIGFDVAFLRKLAFLGNRDQLAKLSHRCIDTHTLLFVLADSGRIPAEAVSSGGAFEHFGIEIDEQLRHTALADARATRELLRQVVKLL